jgi:hypothetical protein
VPILFLAALPKVDLPLHPPQVILGGGQFAGRSATEILSEYAATNQAL